MDRQQIEQGLNQALDVIETNPGLAAARLHPVLRAISDEANVRGLLQAAIGRLDWKVSEVYRQTKPYLEEPDKALGQELDMPKLVGLLESARDKNLAEVEPEQGGNMNQWRTFAGDGRPEPMTEVILCVLPFERPPMIVTGFYAEGPQETDGTPTWFTYAGSFHEVQVACWLPVPSGWESLASEERFRARWNRSRVQAQGEAHLFDACSEEGQIVPLLDQAGQEIGLKCSGCNWQEVY